MKIALIAMSGIRVCDTELLELGLTLPGFVERSKTIASLPSLGLLTLAGMTPPEHEIRYIESEDLVQDGTYPDLPGGYDLVGTYLPASGATTIEALHLLEQFDLSERAGGAVWAALLAQALLLSFEDRVADLGTPDEHAQVLVSKEGAATRAAAGTLLL